MTYRCKSMCYRYAYAPVTYEPLTVWGRNEESWVNPYTLLNSSLGYDDLDDFGGGYFAQFFVWWWGPAFTAILALTLMPTVPYVRRVGTRGALSDVIYKARNLYHHRCHLCICLGQHT